MNPEINRRLGQVRRAMTTIWNRSQGGVLAGLDRRFPTAKAKETKPLYRCGNRLCPSTNITIEDAPPDWSPGWIMVRCHDHDPEILTSYPKIKEARNQ